MIISSLSAWSLFFGIVLLSTLAGLAIVSFASWRREAELAGIPFALGVLIGPFVLGLTACASLALFPGAENQSHLLTIFGFLSLVASPIAFRRRRIAIPNFLEHFDVSPQTIVFWALFGLWTLNLLVDSALMPLTQNDALEYMTVGQALFESRDLATYPMLNPVEAKSGFFGPWTHPPLYVALLYVANAIQGFGDTPGLGRMVAPWFLIGTTFLTIQIVATISKRAAPLAGLVLLSSPLLFLGAGASLIDALPVAGAAMLLALAGLKEKSGANAVLFTGFILGFSLWTHSQSILNVALWSGMYFVREIYRQPLTRTFKHLILVVGVAFAVCGFPYFRNLEVFGSLISDNPLVFQIPSLNWPEYFRLARGYELISDQIQYGLLKGWFVPEAYSLAFWLMVPGLYKMALSARPATLAKPDSDLGFDFSFNAFLFIAIYLTGVAASLLIQTDLMIRNERYLLIVIPFVSVLAAYTFEWCFVTRRTLAKLFVVALAVIWLYQLFVVGGHKRRAYRVSPQNLFENIDSKLKSWPPFLATEYLRSQTENSSIVLSMKPADMYYARRKMISYLDPRLVEVYAGNSVPDVYRNLSLLNVQYVHVPDYSLPPLYNSKIQDLIADVNYACLEHSIGGHQIYKLKESSASNVLVKGEALIPNWSRNRMLIIGGRTGLFRFNLDHNLIASPVISRFSVPVPIFQREFSTILSTGQTDVFGKASKHDMITVKPNTEYLIKIELSGRAFVGIYVPQYDGKENFLDASEESATTAEALGDWRALARQRIGEIALSSSDVRTFQRRIVTSSGVEGIRIAIEHRGNSEVSIGKLQVTEVDNSACRKLSASQDEKF